jgi:hypothetical protein
MATCVVSGDGTGLVAAERPRDRTTKEEKNFIFSMVVVDGEGVDE